MADGGTSEASAGSASPQGGTHRNWEKVAKQVDDTPEAEGKLGRGIGQFDPEKEDRGEVHTGIERNVDKNTSQLPADRSGSR
jgi:hypothetical protein